MFRLRSRIFFIYLLIDVAHICASFYGPFNFNPALTPQCNPALIRIYLAAYLFWGISLIFLLYGAHLYYTDRYLSISEEWLKVASCVLYSATLTALFLFFLKADIFSR